MVPIIEAAARINKVNRASFTDEKKFQTASIKRQKALVSFFIAALYCSVHVLIVVAGLTTAGPEKQVECLYVANISKFLINECQ